MSVIRLHGIVDGRCTCGRRGCRSPGKHPDVGPSWKRFRRGRADLALVRRWFTQKPYANVGMVAGEISAILVLDADGEAGVTELERRGYPRPGRLGVVPVVFTSTFGTPVIGR